MIDGVLTFFWVGRPLHPHYKALGSQFEPLDDVLPTQSIPFALSPSGLIPSPRFSEFSPSPALVQHLRSILPEYVPMVPQSAPDPESDSGPIRTTASADNISSQQSTGGFALPTIPMPAVNLNMDVRNLKWNWPGYLTFGKNSKDKEREKSGKVSRDEQKKPDAELESKPDADGEGGASSVDGDSPGADPPKEEEKLVVEVEVDTASLADAIGSENGRGGSSNEHSPGAGTPSEAPSSPATRTIRPIPDDVTPVAVQPADPVSVLQGIYETSQQSTSTRPPSPSPEKELPPAISEPPSPPPPVTLSQTTVHLAPLEHPLRTTKRRLYYLTVRRPSRVSFFKDLNWKCVLLALTERGHHRRYS